MKTSNFPGGEGFYFSALATLECSVRIVERRLMHHYRHDVSLSDSGAHEHVQTTLVRNAC